ncbi:hypothetical protein TIFTF001_027343 [Ficus carica]|uniref:Uncharacterized protein n=1 Tax=Ficus carica TaxID=3494 RepID=A0AA88J044_FICCA|nr:hypothetical protein TIFTF001_027343 [Ficus carica]
MQYYLLLTPVGVDEVPKEDDVFLNLFLRPPKFDTHGTPAHLFLAIPREVDFACEAEIGTMRGLPP